MPINQCRNSFIKPSVDLMNLAAVWTVAGLVVAGVVETGGVLGGFVAQFIFMTASLLHEGRPRMA